MEHGKYLIVTNDDWVSISIKDIPPTLCELESVKQEGSHIEDGTFLYI
jgi:hypothetical protein